jgi:hypothetical protein
VTVWRSIRIVDQERDWILLQLTTVLAVQNERTRGAVWGPGEPPAWWEDALHEADQRFESVRRPFWLNHAEFCASRMD